VSGLMHYADLSPIPVRSAVKSYAVTIDPVTVNIANWLLIRQPEQ